MVGRGSLPLQLLTVLEYLAGQGSNSTWEGVVQFSSVAQSCLTLRPHGLHHARLPCLSTTPGAYSNSCPSHLVGTHKCWVKDAYYPKVLGQPRIPVCA